MEASNLEELKVMLEGMPPRCRVTAIACWESYFWGDWDDPPMGGIKEAAWAYAWTLERESPTRKRKTPHQIEKELQRLASSARDLKIKIERVSQECMELFESATSTTPPLAPSQVNDPEGYATHSVLKAWFHLPMEHQSKELSVQRHDPFSIDCGIRPDELGALACTFDHLAHEVAARKESPKGFRKGTIYRLTSLEWLLFCIGRMANFRKRPMPHIIPIARKVHEWATRTPPPGGDWGERPFDRIKPRLKELHWSEPDEIRVPRLRAPKVRTENTESPSTQAMRLANEAAAKLREGGTPPPF